MGYIVDGAVLAACIAGYRVYTDRRKSMIHKPWDSYRHLLINIPRHSGDFIASTCFDVLCHYPEKSRKLMDQALSLLSLRDSPRVSEIRAFIQTRTARYYIWSHFGNLGYLQRVAKPNREMTSLFQTSRSWSNNIIFTSPHLFSYVKDDTLRDYLHLLSLVRDGMVGVIEASPSELSAIMNHIKESKRDILQDIRKGHVLDRKSESSIPMIHALRMNIEGFLFGHTGPDPDRSSYIDKSIKDDSDGLLERLYPYLEVVVDTAGESLRSGKSIFNSACPNVEVFVPFLRLDDQIVGIGRGSNAFILDPLSASIRLDGTSPSAQDLTVGQTYTLSLATGNEEMQVQYIGRHGEAIKVKVP